MNILISGFDPFGNRPVNVSWEIAKKFTGKDGVKVILLPVSFSNAHNSLINVVESKDYDLIIMMGETAASKDAVRLERVALNMKDSSMSDNEGKKGDEEEIIAGASKAYFTKFPVKKMTLALKEKGYKVKVTNSAGTFVCNSLYYNILHYLEDNKIQTKALFVHLPVSTEIVSLSEMESIIRDLIKTYIEFEKVEREDLEVANSKTLSTTKQ